MWGVCLPSSHISTHQDVQDCADNAALCWFLLLPQKNSSWFLSIKWRTAPLSQELTWRKYEMLITQLEGNLQVYTQTPVKSKAERCFPNLSTQWEKSREVAMGACAQACAELWSFCLHFLCFVLPIWQFRALFEEFWLYSPEDPAPQLFNDTYFLFTLIFLLCSWLIQHLGSYLNVWEGFFNMPNETQHFTTYFYCSAAGTAWREEEGRL